MLMSILQKCVACHVTAFVVLLIATSARSQTVLIDDFEIDDELEGWEHIDSTIGQDYGPGSFSEESKSFVLKGGGLVPEGTPGGGFIASLWDESYDGNYSDGFLRAKVRAETEGTNAVLALRVTGDIEQGFDNYLIIATTGLDGVKGRGGLGINRIESTITTASPFIRTDFAVGEDWMLEAGAVGDRITAKTWKVGEPEPDAPQIVFFDFLFTEGQFGVVSNINVSDPPVGEAVVHSSFDDITFTFPGPLGDFNNDGDLDVDDLDSLMRHLNSDRNAYFDVNDDWLLDEKDFTMWVTELKNTWFGDANLDGEFNSGDFVSVFQAGKFEQSVAASWSEGDWNGDGEFSSGDFVLAFQEGGYEKGLRGAVVAVPEPSAILLQIALLGIVTIRHRRR